MLESIREVFDSLPPAVVLVLGMVVAASLDFAAAMVDHIRNGTFHATLIGKWAGDKGFPILSVALLFVVDAALKILQLPIDGFDIGAMGIMASGMGVTFIAGEMASILKHLAPKPVEEPVEVE